MTRKYKEGRRSWGAVRQLGSGRFQASFVKDGMRVYAPMTFSTERYADEWLLYERLKIERALLGLTDDPS